MFNLPPDIRRLVIQYAAKENIAFQVALECLVLEGVKALGENQNHKFLPVNKRVQNQ